MEHEARGVLVLLDGSETSRRALDAAVGIARDKELPLTVLAIVPPRLWRAKQGQFQVSPDKHDEEFARDLITEAKAVSKSKGVHATARLRAGGPAAILEEEASRGFDLVVVGERRNLVGAPSLVSIVRSRLTIPLEVVDED